MITVNELRENLAYDKTTGSIFWIKASSPRVKPGQRIEKTKNARYLKVQLHRKPLLAHRVAWALHYGEWPKDQIDHIDGDGFNNRIDNLRCVSGSENMKNLAKHRAGKHFGVHQHPNGKWQASVKEQYIGLFQSQDEAIAAVYGYMKAIGLKER